MRTMIDMGLEFAEQPANESWIQIMKTGKFQHGTYGEINITQADLHQFKDNFDKGVRGVELAVDVNHEAGKGSVAWFKELKVEPGKLMARVAWTEEGKQMISSGKYRYFSPEFAFTYTDPESGKKFKDVLLGGAITNRPFLKNMDPIELSEDGVDVWFKFGEPDPQDNPDDPDGDGDDDRTTDPNLNPDWMDDVKKGFTKWPSSKPDQVAQLIKAGISKDDADKAYEAEQKKQKAKKLAEGAANDDAKQEQAARAKKYGISVKDGGNVSKPSAYSDVPDDKFADPVNFRYPITSEYAMAAYRYFAKPKNQEQYSPAERKTIAQRIVSALPDANKDEAKKTFKLDDGTVNSNDPATQDGNVPARPNDDVDAGKFNEGVHGMDAIKLQEQLEAEKNARLQLQEQVKRMTLSEKVQGFMFNEATKKGKILPAQKDAVLEFMMKLDDEQIVKFSEIVNGLPDAVAFGEEQGHGGTTPTKSRDEMIAERANVLMTENKSLTLKQAIAMADKEIPHIKL